MWRLDRIFMVKRGIIIVENVSSWIDLLHRYNRLLFTNWYVCALKMELLNEEA